tara:strand:+ start:1613 stop:2515 length:903 start_codon:yes stop_codon:yes gene_type:complete
MKKDNKIVCNLCNCTDDAIVYEGPIRDGTAGNYTKNNYKVVKCKSCKLVRLSENPNNDDFYKTNEYRENYNETFLADDYLKMHDKEQSPKLEKIGIDYFRDKIVLDYGCGGGSFLDLIQGVSKETVGIEPFIGYHDHLASNNHKIFSSVNEAIKEYKGKIDTIISTGVIEHVDNPYDYLSTAYDLLKKKGRMYLETDNVNDILFRLNTPYLNKFFYRTVHLWYFEASTIKKMSEKAGFSDIEISHRHNFDLSNLIVWLKEQIPSGVGKLDFFDDRINIAWRSFLEETGSSDLVCIKMKKE